MSEIRFIVCDRCGERKQHPPPRPVAWALLTMDPFGQNKSDAVKVEICDNCAGSLLVWLDAFRTTDTNGAET